MRVSSGRRSGQRFDAEHQVTTEALIFLGQLDPEALGPSLEHATHYEPTPVEHVATLLDAVPIRLERAAFVDLGCGMGRVLLLAARRPFRQVIGVEFSPALCEIARENVAAFDLGLRRCRDVRIVRADALNFALPRGDLVVYMYNPFRGAVMQTVAERLAKAASETRELIVIYHTPLERGLIEATGAFDLAAEFPCGVVYRRALR
jgi:SAM-dependent methyltransferase